MTLQGHYALSMPICHLS